MQKSSKLYPEKRGFQPDAKVRFGGLVLRPEPILYNDERQVVKLSVRNTGDRPVQVGSHFHFFEVNRYLEFERERAYGCHLNIPATTAVRFEPGDEKDVELVPFAGKSRVIGFNGLTMGSVLSEGAPFYLPERTRAIFRAHKRGFKCSGTGHCHNKEK